MKKILKVLGLIILIPYLIIVIFLTTCLLKFNDYKVTEFGDKSLIIIRDDVLEPNFKKGDLVIVTKNKNTEILVNDDIFFYENRGKEMTINYGKVINKTGVTVDEVTFTIEGDHDLSSTFVIGKTGTSKVYHGIGSCLSVLESKWGFLLIVVFPILIAFLYEIYAILKEVSLEVKNSKKRRA